MSRRQGMFGNAKVSDKVFKELPANVARGIQRDLAYVLQKDNPQDVRKWTRALPSQSSLDPRPASASIDYDIHHMLTRKRARKEAANDVKAHPPAKRNLFRTAKELLDDTRSHSTFVDETVLYAKRQGFESTVEQTPTVFKSPPKPPPAREDDEPVFNPDKDPSEVAERILAGLPHLTLRNNDSTTYAEAVEDILLRALTPYFKCVSRSSQPGITDKKPESPNRSFMSRTAPLNLSRSSGLTSQVSESPLSEFRLNLAGMASPSTHSTLQTLQDPFEASGLPVDSSRNSSFPSQVSESPLSEFRLNLPSMASPNSNSTLQTLHDPFEASDIPLYFDNYSYF